jgi:hypothetical protein
MAAEYCYITTLNRKWNAPIIQRHNKNPTRILKQYTEHQTDYTVLITDVS